MGLLQALYLFLRASVISHGTLAAENLALRQQLSVLAHTCTRPKLRPRDRVFWVWLSRLLPDWRSVLRIVQPDTVIKWHQQGFKLYWRWKSTPKAAGRPPIDQEIRDLICRMARENPAWGAPHILSELRLLGYEVSQATVAKYMPKTRKPPSQKLAHISRQSCPRFAGRGPPVSPTRSGPNLRGVFPPARDKHGH